MLQEFKKYIKSLDDDSKTKHNIYVVSGEDIEKVEKIILIPHELKLFYSVLGYGFFHRDIGASYRLIGPHNFEQINLKKDFYEFDPALEIYDTLYHGTKLLFFEVVEGTYLAIDKEDSNGKNAIYYFDQKIADSLEEFLLKFDSNPNLINEIE